FRRSGRDRPCSPRTPERLERGTCNMIDQIGVVGAGTMGHGIAQVALAAGCAVTLCDVSPEQLARAREKIAAGLARRSGPETGEARLGREADSAGGRTPGGAALERLKLASRLAELSDAQFV